MKSKTGWTQTWLVLAVGALCLAFTLSMSAQVKTETTTERGQAVHETTVERGEVVLVRDPRLETGYEVAAHSHRNYNPKDHHHGSNGDGQGLAHQSAKLCHPHP